MTNTTLYNLWSIVTFIFLAIVGSYGFIKIAGDDTKKVIRAVAAFLWLLLISTWYALLMAIVRIIIPL